MDHTVENKHFPGVFKATPLRAPVRPWGHAPRQANPVLTQGRRGAQGRDTPPQIVFFRHLFNAKCTHVHFNNFFEGSQIYKIISKRFFKLCIICRLCPAIHNYFHCILLGHVLCSINNTAISLFSTLKCLPIGYVRYLRARKRKVQCCDVVTYLVN